VAPGFPPEFILDLIGGGNDDTGGDIKKLWHNHRLTKNKLKLAFFTSAGLIFVPAVYGYI